MFFRENFSFIYLHRRLFLLDSHSASAPFTIFFFLLHGLFGENLLRRSAKTDKRCCDDVYVCICVGVEGLNGELFIAFKGGRKFTSVLPTHLRKKTLFIQWTFLGWFGKLWNFSISTKNTFGARRNFSLDDDVTPAGWEIDEEISFLSVLQPWPHATRFLLLFAISLTNLRSKISFRRHSSAIRRLSIASLKEIEDWGEQETSWLVANQTMTGFVACEVKIDMTTELLRW